MEHQLKAKAVPEAYKSAVHFWLIDFWPGYQFSAVDGLKIKSIIKKIEGILKFAGKPTDEATVINAFKIICNQLPVYYQGKNLSKIDSGFNEIVKEIKDKNNGVTRSSRPTNQFTESSDFVNRLRESRRSAY